MLLIRFFVFTLCFIVQILPNQATLGCPTGSVQVPDNIGEEKWKCMLFANYARQYLTAEQTCTSNRGHLVSIANGFVNTFITRKFFYKTKILQM